MQRRKFKIKSDPVIYCSCEHGISHGRQNIFALRYFLIITESNKLCIRPFNEFLIMLYSRLRTNWFWYAVTAVKTDSGKTYVRYSSASRSVIGPPCSLHLMRCIRGWYRCMEFSTIWNQRRKKIENVLKSNIEVLCGSGILDSTQIFAPFNTQAAAFHNFKYAI